METVEKLTRFRVVRNDAEKRLALDEAKRDGFKWVSTSRVPLTSELIPTFIPGCYRMKFERKLKNGRH